MSTRIITAALGMCLAAFAMTTSAEARLDHGIVASHYDEDSRPAKKHKSYKSAKNSRSAYYKNGKKRTAKYRSGKSKSYARSSIKGRSVTAAASGGGGTSRSCLQPQARALLGRIESQFGPVQIISTCRPGAVIAGSGKPSKHRYGLAIDFNAGGRKGAIVQWLIANHHSGGTMTYSGMSHVHVDIGPRFVSLGSRSRG